MVKSGDIIPMQVNSAAFEQEKMIPAKFTCDGENVNPPINLAEIPSQAKSIVLIVDDPDSPGGTWNHWLVWNINPNTKEISENTVPNEAIQGKNDFGENKYGGPCPPMGTHHYFFRVYALDTLLNIPEGSGRADLDLIMKNHVIATGELMGIYQKK